ncbi:QueE-like radical SAM domain [Gordonia phage Sour]|uniref:QueE-like queosine biosynthesis protein n=1 Tax=Gordonia phage Sour TaxID=2182349 RepID=A0A2U8UKL0_9CAUD|nr:QueE-like radical SAM domain [Gordonia phage Sour]AWN04207.1 QueE-like queosine biosynthesis protein [Gordonia phage Sour]
MCFIRLGGCNLSCSWCDTPYTWDASRFDLKVENPMTSIAEIEWRLSELPGGPIPVVVSGGEPLMHQRGHAFAALLAMLKRNGREIHIETNGTVEPLPSTQVLVDHFTVSPKLPNAGEHKRSQDPTPWSGWAQVSSSIWKVVVTDEADVIEAVQRAEAHGIPRQRIWVMPEGIDAETLARRWPTIARAAADLGINASHRLHVMAWGDTKGT